MTAINYARNLAGSDVGSAHFNHPRYEVRSARWHIVRPVLSTTSVAVRPSGSSGALHAGGGGFAALEAGWRRVAGVSMF